MPLQRLGSAYYLAYWGVIGLYQGFQSIHFRELGLSAAQIGLALALFPLFTVGFSPLVAAWADARGRRVQALAVSLGAMAVSLVLLGLARDFGGVLAGMALLGLSQSAVAPLADSLVGRMASANGLEFGRMRLWGSLGFSLASAAAGQVWARVGFGPMFAAAGLLFVPLVLLARRLPEVRADESRGKPGGTARPRLALRELLALDRGTLVVLGAVLLMGFGLGLAAPFLSLAIEDRGGTAAMAGLLFGVIALLELPSMRLEGHLARRLGDASTLTLSCAVYALAYLGMAAAPSAPWMLACGALVGVGFGLFFVSSVRIVDARARPHQVSTLQSLRNGAAFGVAPLLAGPLGGLIYQNLGPAALFGLCAAFYLLALALLWHFRSAVNTPAPQTGEIVR